MDDKALLRVACMHTSYENLHADASRVLNNILSFRQVTACGCCHASLDASLLDSSMHIVTEKFPSQKNFIEPWIINHTDLLSIVDYPILTNPFRNLPWCSVICYYLYIFLLHYKYGRGIFLPLCVCTYTLLLPGCCQISLYRWKTKQTTYILNLIQFG
jgi:hypothetical protein